MADIKGDKTKQPPECEPKWIPFSTDNPHDPWFGGPLVLSAVLLLASIFIR